MDRQFLEFWGNFLLNVAKGQKQFEDMTRWIHQGFKGFDDLNAMFTKCYGLEKLGEDSPDYIKAWQDAMDVFQRSFKDYLSLMNVVPRDEYNELVKKYEDLKEKVADREETVKHLQLLLERQGTDEGHLTKGFHDLIKKQTEEFQELMKSLGQSLEKRSTGKA
jgi:chromosome segregation ATPase